MFYGGDNISVSSVMNDPSYALGHVHGSGRFAAWDQFLKLFFEPSPFVGSGLGATQHYFYTHSIKGLGVIHSEYIRLLCEVGIVGLGCFALAMLTYQLRLLRGYQNIQEAQARRYTLAATGTLLAYLVFLATDNGFDYVSQFAVYVFGYIAMSEKAKELEEPDITSEVAASNLAYRHRYNGLCASARYPILQE
jgi:O-antigen ligase